MHCFIVPSNLGWIASSSNIWWSTVHIKGISTQNSHMRAPRFEDGISLLWYIRLMYIDTVSPSQSENNVMVLGYVSTRPSCLLTLHVSWPSLSAEVQNFLLFGTPCVVHLFRDTPKQWLLGRSKSSKAVNNYNFQCTHLSKWQSWPCIACRARQFFLSVGLHLCYTHRQKNTGYCVFYSPLHMLTAAVIVSTAEIAVVSW